MTVATPVRAGLLGLGALLLLPVPSVHAQDRGEIAGTVVGARGKPLSFANVVLVDTEMGSMTDSDGTFRVRLVPPGSYLVRISYLGYEAEADTVQVVAGETATMHVVLDPVPYVPYPGKVRHGVPLGDVIPLLVSSPRVQAFRLPAYRTPGGDTTSAAGPILSRNQVRTLQWLLLEKEVRLIGGKWVVIPRTCFWSPTLEFRFATGYRQGAVTVDLHCMQYQMKAGDLTDAGLLTFKSQEGFLRFALRLFPDDPVLLELKEGLENR